MRAVDRGALDAAIELYDARQYPGVVALATDALEGEPEDPPLLLLRARAHIALRRDLEAQADLRDLIRLDPQCAMAYRLLGELAARRDEHGSAAIFFREALRLDPSDREAADWLLVVGPDSRPVGARIARGTRSPDERPTKPFTAARGSGAQVAPAPVAERPPILEVPTITGRPSDAKPPAKPAPRATTRPSRPPELPGFDEYLVTSGILTRERLRAAQAYQRSMRVQLSTAVVTLGLATPQRIEWAVVAHTQLSHVRP
jgi:tetratricopeptide (TPR) repeat protein